MRTPLGGGWKAKPLGQSPGTTVYAIGVFDLFHRGHLEFLKSARALGDRLVVAINGDEMVTSYKRRPLNNEADRLAIVSALRCVDRAFVIEGYDNRSELIRNEIDIIAHGDDWEPVSYMKQIVVDQRFLDQQGICLQFVPYHAGVSTTSIIQAIRGAP